MAVETILRSYPDRINVVSWPLRGRIEAIPNVLFPEKSVGSWPMGMAV